jgi:ADP-heptose:LPS heptosyltransferase
LLFRRIDTLEDDGHVVVLRHGNIGDHLAALPAYRAIRRRCPAGRLTLLTSGGGRPAGLELLAAERLFDAVVAPPPRRRRGFLGITGMVRLVKGLAPDGVVYLSSDKAGLRILVRDMVAMFLAGVRRAGGFSLGKVRLWRRWQAVHGSFPSETDRLLAILGGIGIRSGPQDHRSLRLGPGRPDFPDAGLTWVALCPGGKFQVNRWPVERYNALARELLRRPGLGIVVVGGSGDVADGRRICDELPPERALNYAGRLSLGETGALLRRHCRLLVSNDTGVGHLAAALGVPVVSVMSARDFPGCWLPHGMNVALRHGVKCQVCLKETCQDPKCIEGVHVQDVLRAVRDMLSQAQARAVLEV